MDNIRPIRSEEDYERACDRIAEIFQAEPGTPEGDEADVLEVLIADYDAQHYAIPPGDPIAVIEFKMHELEISQRELGRRLGWGSGRVSEILNHKRGLTLPMIQRLAEVLEINPRHLTGEQSVFGGRRPEPESSSLLR